MKNIDLIKDMYPEGVIRSLLARYGKFRAISGMEIKILEVNGKTLKIEAVHKKRKSRLLNQKELIDRAKTIFDFWDGTVHCFPLTYEPELSKINNTWIRKKMGEYEVKNKDIERNLGLDKSTVSTIINGGRSLTKSQKALFYYYFLHFDTYQAMEHLQEIVSRHKKEA